MKLSDYVIQFLQEKGIKRIHGVTGGAIMFLTESIRKSNIEFIAMLAEQGAGIAAEAESIYVNDVSVLLTTAGPGITNAVTAINSAWIDSNPLLVISGQCKTADSMQGTELRQKGIQEVDAVEMLKLITKYAKSIKDSKKIKYELEKAFYHLTHGRKGPVFLELPLDIQNTEIDENNLKSWISLEEEIETNLSGFTKPNLDLKINKLIDLFNNSKKSVILAGNGIRQSGALEEFKTLVDHINIPILLTWKSLDFFNENYEYNYGRPGSIASRYANNILQSCDLLISIGARIDLPTCAFDYSNFAPNAKKVIVDIDITEIDKLKFEKELVFHCDAKIFLEKFLNAVKIKRKKTNYDFLLDVDKKNWLHYCMNLRDKYPICLPEYYEQNEYVNPYVFTEELSKNSQFDDVIVTASSGSASEIMAQAYKIKEGQRYISSNGLGAMGFGICHSIGAAFASNREKRVICIEGDGSFFMNSHHLQTAVQYKLPIIFFVWNNNQYKSIRCTHMKFFGEKIGCDEESGLTLPNLNKIAYSYGIKYYKIHNHTHNLWGYKLISIQDFMKNILNENDVYLPIIVEVMTDPNFQTQPRIQNYVDENGKMQSGKLENMWPFIEEK